MRRIKVDYAAALCFAGAFGVAVTFFALQQALFNPVIGSRDGASSVLSLSRNTPSDELLSWGEFKSYRDTATIPEAVSAEGMALTDLVLEIPPHMRVVTVRTVASHYLASLGLRPFLGSDIGADADREAAIAVILSHRLWQSLGGQPDFIGRTIWLGNRPVTVAGVAPPDFRGTNLDTREDLWVPLGAAATIGPWRASDVFTTQTGAPFRWLKTIVHARNRNAALEEARARLGPSELIPLRSAAYPRQFRPIIERLMRTIAIFVGVLLAVAAINISGLRLVSSLRRAQELFTRRALGASPWRMTGLVSCETLVMAVVGTALGLTIAASILLFLSRADLPGHVSIAQLPFRLDSAVVAQSAAVGLLMITVSVLAAMLGLRAHAATASTSVRSVSAPLRTAQRLLLVPQVAAVVILCTAGVTLALDTAKGFSADLGFSRDLIFFTIESNQFEASAPASRRLFAGEVSNIIKALPGVSGAALGRTIFGPGIGMTSWSLDVGGKSRPLRVPYLVRRVGSGFFETAGIPLWAGRPLLDADTTGAPLVAVVTTSLLREISVDPAQAIGTTVTLPSHGAVEIVGIVGDVVREGVSAAGRPTLFVPFGQSTQPPFLDYVVRVEGNPVDVVPRIQSAARTVLFDARVGNVRTPERLITRQLADGLLAARATLVLAGVAVLATLFGLGAVVSLMVQTRICEIGIRSALGATPGNLRTHFAWFGAGPTLAGCTLGFLAASTTSHLLRPLLHTNAPGWGSSFVVTLVVGAVAVGVCYLIAQRATRVEPSRLLRNI